MSSAVPIGSGFLTVYRYYTHTSTTLVILGHTTILEINRLCSNVRNLPVPDTVVGDPLQELLSKLNGMEGWVTRGEDDTVFHNDT